MVIKSVKLQDFRCHKEYFLECSDLTTLILGENGCGKTSVLEAIYVAMRGKSFRAVDREIVRRGAEYYRIEIMRENSEKYVVMYDGGVAAGVGPGVGGGASSGVRSGMGGGKTYLLAEKKYKRLPAKYKYPVILFEPTDLNLVTASPGRRRDYFDRLIGQLDTKYSNSLSRYTKALRQRNELLKREFVTADELFPWDTMLASLGVEIARKRRDFVAMIDAGFTDKYRTIADNGDVVSLVYNTEVTQDESGYLARLSADFGRDRMLGYGGYGIHRDDFGFIFNENPAEGSASRGELRSMVLALKFIEAEMVERILNQKPLILLDDVFSELDDNRQEALKTNFKDNQIIITSVK